MSCFCFFQINIFANTISFNIRLFVCFAMTTVDLNYAQFWQPFSKSTLKRTCALYNSKEAGSEVTTQLCDSVQLANDTDKSQSK